MGVCREAKAYARRGRLVFVLWGGTAAIGLGGALPRAAAAQDVAVPPRVHVPLLIKLLNFDRNLPSLLRGQLTVGLLYQEGYRTSRSVARDVQAALGKLPEDILGGYPIVVTALDADTVKDLGGALVKGGFHVLYVAPLRAFDLGALVAAADGANVRTMTGVPQYVKQGVAVAIDQEGGRSEIVINLLASRAQGADFTAQLLKLARIVD